MEFGLLGPLLVRGEAGEVAVPAARQRVLLAALLFRANQVVPVDELAETLWDGGLPPTALVTLRNYVKRLRRVLGDGDRSRIVTRDDGYLICVAAGELDLARFELLRGQAGQCARLERWAEASAALHAALALWRGEPLADVRSEALVRRELPRLVESRLQATEDRIDADLHLGRHGEVIAELRQLCEAEPLRERLCELLMLALYRAGRQAGALEAYQQARSILVGELGIEPGPGLRELHRRVLAGDPALAAPPPEPAAVAVPVPRQLPAGVRHFAGRSGEIARLSGLIEEASRGAGTVVISAIGGTAGVGKTALAVHWAHRVAERFPDGQLYVNLRGFDPSSAPATPEEAIRGFLDALGVPGERIPAGLEAQAGLYRSLLAAKKVLIVADNARDEAQVRPLMPASPGCLVLVTSRRRLSGLAAAEDAHALTLDVLTAADAADLLARRIGAARLTAEPGPAAELISLCARLPLALAVTAARAAAHPHFPLAALAAELRDEQHRLTVLDAGDPATSVRAAFSWSYRHLTEPATRMFRLLGLAPGAGITGHAAAGLAGLSLVQASDLLAELAQAHMLTEHTAGRYAFHDLLRAYAAELAHAHDSDQQRRDALTGLFDYYLAAAAAAMDALVPAERSRRPRIPPPATPLPPMATPDAARAWLDASRATLVAVAAHTDTYDWPAHSIRLAQVLFRYFENGGHSHDAQAVYTHALHAARHTGDRAAQGLEHQHLGAVDHWQGHYPEAADHYRRALALFREIDDKPGQARALANLAFVFARQGRYDDAVSHDRQALATFCELGDQFAQAVLMGNLGTVLCKQGHHQQAASHHREALAIHRELGYREGEAHEQCSLGIALYRQGRYQQAADYLRQGAGLCHELGYRGEATALDYMGLVLSARRHYRQAADHHRQALDLYRATGNRTGEAEALNGLGEALFAAGQSAQARTHHHDALALARQFGDRYQQARAHDGLGRAWHAAGDHARARKHWQQALARYTDLGVPEAGQVRARLDDPGLLQAEKNPAGQA